MIKCFICSFYFASPKEICEHLNNTHGISGENEYTCTICESTHTKLWKYRRHLDVCFSNITITTTPRSVSKGPTTTTTRSVSQDPTTPTPAQKEDQKCILDFESNTHRSALEFVCKFAGNVNIPRNYVFEVLKNFQSFYGAMVAEVFSKFIKPYVCNEQQINVEYLQNILENPYKLVSTEYDLDSVLTDAHLIEPLKKVDLIAPASTGKVDSKKNRSKIDPEIEAPTEKEKVTLMPLEFQFKKFFELPEVFELTQKYAEEVSGQTLTHFTNGMLWKKKLEAYNDNDIVIPYHLHMDDVQINNTLGSHRVKGLETCTYYSFPTVPPQFNSRLENIFVAQLFSSYANKDFGNLACFRNMINELNKFALDGITLNIDGEEKKVYFVLGLILGDNKGVNDLCGFAKSYRANYFCRFCRLHRKQTETATSQVDKMMRNEKNYHNDLKRNDFSSTGINEESIVNKFFFSHATNSIGVDTMHDILEGILHYHMSEIILYFIQEGTFTLDQLNQLKFDLCYGQVESGNKSPPISMKRLKRRKLLMSASEMDTFARHFAFIVGDLVPTNNEVWKFYLQTMKFVDLVDLKSYTENNLEDLTETISNMNTMYLSLFKKTLKPKHHIITHYPGLIRSFGPLCYLSSMRFEAKHKFIKNYTKNTVSRLNVSYSLGRKMQYVFASYLLNNTGLKDKVSMASSRYIQLKNAKIYEQVEKTKELKNILTKKIKETEKVTINGITFSTKLWITLKENRKLVLLEIMKIVYVTNKISDVFFICKEYKNVGYNRNYGCYEFDVSSSGRNFKFISAVRALKERQYPVSVHVMAEEIHRFRTKPF